MLLRTSLLCSAVLALVPSALAQDATAPVAARAATAAGELRFDVGGITVRRWSEGGVARAAVQRAGGAWTPIAAPDDLLRLVMGQFDPKAGMPAYEAPFAAPAGTRLQVVQFHTQVLPEYRDALAAAGAQILHFVPSDCLLVRGDATAMAAVAKLQCVRWVGAMANAWKVDATVREFLRAGAGAMELNLVLASKQDRARLAEQVTALGGKVTDHCDGSTMLRASLTPAQLGALFAQDTVVFADPVTEASFDMDNARIQGGGAYVETMAGYNGQGVLAEITEPFEETHPDFAGRFVVRGTNTVQTHGHCTAGIVAGAGANNAAARGMLSQCSVIENGYYPNTGVHYANIVGSVDPTSATKSMQATSSWGAAQTTQYTAISQSVDDALFVADFVRTQSMSNLGTQSVRPEAWPKNTISVGGVKHLNNSNPADDNWTNGASIGPASDGRLKPDVCAYYESVLTSDRTSTAGYNTAAGVAGDYYTSFSGTSSATPIVNGHVGIIQQMFTDGLFKNVLPQPATAANRFANKPKMATVKAMLCNTAAQYSFAAPTADLSRVKQGWGFPSLQRLYDNRDKIVVLDEYDALQVGQTRAYWIYVAPGTPELRVTMVYSDPAAVALSAVHLINDANLKVTRFSDGTSWWGNNGLADGNFSTSGGAPNNRDNIECVYLQNPTAGIYRVEVNALSIPQDGKLETPQVDMDYAMAMHPMGGGYNTTGGLAFDLASSGPGNLQFNASNVPATGWTDGFTVFSFATSRGLGFGRFFGLEDDGLTVSLYGSPAAAGNVFHFTNTGGQYPYVGVTFPDPSLVSLLAGLKLDAMVMLWNNGTLVGVSNVDRITLQ